MWIPLKLFEGVNVYTFIAGRAITQAPDPAKAATGFPKRNHPHPGASKQAGNSLLRGDDSEKFNGQCAGTPGKDLVSGGSV